MRKPVEPRQSEDVEMCATVRITVNDPEAIERVTGPGGDEWRSQAYPLRPRQDVLNHWAANAVGNGIADASRLEGWADLAPGTVTFEVWDVEALDA